MIKNYTLFSLFFFLGLLISNVAQGQFFNMPKTNLGIGLKSGAKLNKSSKSRITAAAIFNFVPNAGQTIIPQINFLNHTPQTIMIGYTFRKLYNTKINLKLI
jgi:hypothetical protein